MQPALIFGRGTLSYGYCMLLYGNMYGLIYDDMVICVYGRMIICGVFRAHAYIC